MLNKFLIVNKNNSLNFFFLYPILFTDFDNYKQQAGKDNAMTPLQKILATTDNLLPDDDHPDRPDPLKLTDKEKSQALKELVAKHKNDPPVQSKKARNKFRL